MHVGISMQAKGSGSCGCRRPSSRQMMNSRQGLRSLRVFRSSSAILQRPNCKHRAGVLGMLAPAACMPTEGRGTPAIRILRKSLRRGGVHVGHAGTSSTRVIKKAETLTGRRCDDTSVTCKGTGTCLQAQSLVCACIDCDPLRSILQPRPQRAHTRTHFVADAAQPRRTLFCSALMSTPGPPPRHRVELLPPALPLPSPMSCCCCCCKFGPCASPATGCLTSPC